MTKRGRDTEREAFWRLALSEQRASGLSVRAFCRREGLSQASWYAWRRTLAEREAGVVDPQPVAADVDHPSAADAPHVEADPKGEGVASSPASMGFAEVTWRDDEDEPTARAPRSVAWSIEVVLPAGLAMRVGDGFDAATLRRVVEALS